ncbi:golgin subfamily A member 4-like isoform X2 [Athene noctua]|uniref:golgin subfamily A member 4-like isoform X3 n=1 Tax=Athene noctua TaxID=126797 RepID=UPI003EBBFDB3
MVRYALNCLTRLSHLNDKFKVQQKKSAQKLLWNQEAMKSSEERVAELEKCHKKEMAAKDRELNERLQAQEKAFQGKMKAALEINRIEYLKALQEQEEQGSLALELLELQKKAIQSQCDKKVQRMHQEVKTSRTRILELESSLAKYLEEARKQSEEKKQHNKEISDIVEKHKNELENMKQQQEKLWTEKLQILKQQQVTEMEKMREKQEQEIATILKEKETVFRAHIEEMNEKTLQKLDVKQAEFEALSSELSEALKIRHDLEQELSALNSKVCEARQELEEERKRHKEEVEVMSKEHAMSIQGVEEVLKEELNQLRQSLEKLAEQEAKLKKELENKQLEFSQKESEFNAKMLEMAHASTAGINDAVSKLECNHKEQLESLAEAHRRELVEITRSWEEKLHQQVEELQEKHEMELQEKEQEVGDLKEELATCSAEKEGSRAEITRLKGEQVTREESLKELQEQLRQSVSKVNALSDKESDLKTQLKKLEGDLNQALKEQSGLEEQLSEQKAVEEKDKAKITELADERTLNLSSSSDYLVNVLGLGPWVPEQFVFQVEKREANSCTGRPVEKL